MKVDPPLRWWARLGNDRAIANARAAALECSQRRLERVEVEQFLASYVAPAAAGPGRGHRGRTEVRVAGRGR